MTPPTLEQSPITSATSDASSAYELQPYTRDALPQILALLQRTLGNTGAVRKTEEFWLWKHHANPFGISYGIYAWDKTVGQAASLRVLMRWTFTGIGGGTVQGARAVDTATHPDYQRRGLFSTLTRRAIAELADEGVDFIFNTPNQKSLPGYLKMGWQEAARWPLYVRVMRPLRMAYRRIRSLPIDTATSTASHFRSGILPWEKFSEDYGDQIVELLDSWGRSRPQNGIRTQRSLDYLTWRYGGHPHIQYGVYPHLNQHSRLGGFAIIRPNVRYGWQETVLTELLLSKLDLSEGLQLMRGLSRQLYSDYLIAHFSRNSLEAEVLRRSNFWKVPRKHIVFTVRPLQPSVSYLTRPEAWDLTLGDLELF